MHGLLVDTCSTHYVSLCFGAPACRVFPDHLMPYATVPWVPPSARLRAAIVPPGGARPSPACEDEAVVGHLGSLCVLATRATRRRKNGGHSSARCHVPRTIGRPSTRGVHRPGDSCQHAMTHQHARAHRPEIERVRIALQERLAAMLSTHDHAYVSQDSLTEMYTYLDSQNGQQGPFSLNQLFSWCAAGQMPSTTMVRLDKPNETFRALFDVPGFSTWVHPFAQSWHGLAQRLAREQQQLPPPQLTPGLASSTPPARAAAAAEAADATAQLTEPPTPATAPGPTVPSQPDAQLPASFADYVKALNGGTMKCSLQPFGVRKDFRIRSEFFRIDRTTAKPSEDESG